MTGTQVGIVTESAHGRAASLKSAPIASELLAMAASWW